MGNPSTTTPFTTGQQWGKRLHGIYSMTSSSDLIYGYPISEWVKRRDLTRMRGNLDRSPAKTVNRHAPLNPLPRQQRPSDRYRLDIDPTLLRRIDVQSISIWGCFCYLGIGEDQCMHWQISIGINWKICYPERQNSYMHRPMKIV